VASAGQVDADIVIDDYRDIIRDDLREACIRESSKHGVVYVESDAWTKVLEHWMAKNGIYGCENMPCRARCPYETWDREGRAGALPDEVF